MRRTDRLPSTWRSCPSRSASLAPGSCPAVAGDAEIVAAVTGLLLASTGDGGVGRNCRGGSTTRFRRRARRWAQRDTGCPAVPGAAVLALGWVPRAVLAVGGAARGWADSCCRRWRRASARPSGEIDCFRSRPWPWSPRCHRTGRGSAGLSVVAVALMIIGVVGYSCRKAPAGGPAQTPPRQPTALNTNSVRRPASWLSRACRLHGSWVSMIRRTRHAVRRVDPALLRSTGYATVRLCTLGLRPSIP